MSNWSLERGGAPAFWRSAQTSLSGRPMKVSRIGQGRIQQKGGELHEIR
jgi:hypothetical protein